MSRDFKEFNLTVDGVEKAFKIYKPTIGDNREAQKVRSAAFADSVKSKAILRSQLNTVLRERGLWDDLKEAQYEALRKEVLDYERQLDSGGIRKSFARTIALKMRKLRDEMRDMLMERSVLDNETAEGQADNMMFNYLVAICTYVVYNDKEEKFFKSLEDYLNSSFVELSIKAAEALSALLYGNLGETVVNSLSENKFLKEFGFVDDKYRLINQDKHLIDNDGRLIDEQNRYVDKDGNFVNKEGALVDEDGHLKVDKLPFLDDDDKPIPKVEEISG